MSNVAERIKKQMESLDAPGRIHHCEGEEFAYFRPTEIKELVALAGELREAKEGAEKQLSELRKDVIALAKESNALRAELEELKQRCFVRFAGDECWIYQGDDNDHLETLVCPVVIRPQVLLALTSELKRVTAARDGLQVQFGELDESWENRRKKWLVDVETQEQRAEQAEKELEKEKRDYGIQEKLLFDSQTYAQFQFDGKLKAIERANTAESKLKGAKEGNKTMLRHTNFLCTLLVSMADKHIPTNSPDFELCRGAITGWKNDRGDIVAATMEG